MMQARYFDLGCKLIGLYFLVWAVIELLGSLSSTILALGSEKDLSGLTGLLYLVTPATRILVLIVGLYLIRKSSMVRGFALLDEGDSISAEATEYFTVGVKLYGVILVVAMIPDILRVLSIYLFLVADAPYGTTPTQAESMGLSTNFFVPITSILFGLLLFFRGELLSNWAFAEESPAVSNDENS